MKAVPAITFIVVLALGWQGCGSPGATATRGHEGTSAGSATAAQASPFAKAKVANLLTRALAGDFTPDREVLVDLVEVPPHTTLERHWHPGEEFHYYLEGEPEIAIEGQATIHARPGTVGHIPYRAKHVLSTGEHGAKVLVFRVHTAGEPMRHLVKDEGR